MKIIIGGLQHEHKLGDLAATLFSRLGIKEWEGCQCQRRRKHLNGVIFAPIPIKKVHPTPAYQVPIERHDLEPENFDYGEELL